MYRMKLCVVGLPGSRGPVGVHTPLQALLQVEDLDLDGGRR